MTIGITITGGPELQRKMSKLGSALYEFKDEMEDIGTALTRYLSNEVYLSQGKVLNHPWAKLSPRYERQKVKLYPGHRILDASGTMKQSYFFVSSDQAVTIMNATDYAKYHQEGTSKMPQRLLFAFNKTMISTVASIVRNGLIRKLESV